MLSAALFALLPAMALAAPVKTTGTANVKQVIFQDFPDPSLLQDGDDWYAFATDRKTSSSPLAITNVQVAHSSDFDNWSVTSIDALPEVGAWVQPNSDSTRSAVWAPKVIKNNLGQYVLHYSAAVLGNPSKHCIGAAVSDSPTGPYSPEATPLACPVTEGGAIDSSAFRDTDGSLYVVYKVDGNSIGHGGSCNNGVAPIVPTPIMLQRVADDGFTPIGAPTQILDRDTLDGPLVEAPSLVRTSSGSYILFFSSNCYVSTNYDVTYAFADNIAGPYVKRGPMLLTGTEGLTSPGGADVDADGVHMVFHANGVDEAGKKYRGMYTQVISVDDVNQVVSS